MPEDQNKYFDDDTEWLGPVPKRDPWAAVTYLWRALRTEPDRTNTHAWQYVPGEGMLAALRGLRALTLVGNGGIAILSVNLFGRMLDEADHFLVGSVLLILASLTGLSFACIALLSDLGRHRLEQTKPPDVVRLQGPRKMEESEWRDALGRWRHLKQKYEDDRSTLGNDPRRLEVATEAIRGWRNWNWLNVDAFRHELWALKWALTFLAVSAVGGPAFLLWVALCA